jgi:hypothetical protein
VMGSRRTSRRRPFADLPRASPTCPVRVDQHVLQRSDRDRQSRMPRDKGAHRTSGSNRHIQFDKKSSPRPGT